MTDEELKKLAAEIARLQPQVSMRKSPWFAPSIVLGIIVYAAPIVYLSGKQSDRIDNIEASEKQNVANSITEKDADIQYAQLRNDIQSLKDDNKELRSEIRSLEMRAGATHGQ